MVITLMISNGTGSKPETDKFKKLYGDVYSKFMDQKIMLDLGVDNERLNASLTIRAKRPIKLFWLIRQNRLLLGLEAFQQVQKNNSIFTDNGPSTSGYCLMHVVSGISVFAKGSINNNLGYVVRYDNYNPDTKFNENNIYAASYPGYLPKHFSWPDLTLHP